MMMIDGSIYIYWVGVVIVDMCDDVSFKGDLFVLMNYVWFVNEWFDYWGSMMLYIFFCFFDVVVVCVFEGELKCFVECCVYLVGEIKKGEWE